MKDKAGGDGTMELSAVDDSRKPRLWHRSTWQRCVCDTSQSLQLNVCYINAPRTCLSVDLKARTSASTDSCVSLIANSRAAGSFALRYFVNYIIFHKDSRCASFKLVAIPDQVKQKNQ